MNQFEHPKMLQLTELEWRWSLNPKKKKKITWRRPKFDSYLKCRQSNQPHTFTGPYDDCRLPRVGR